ncbi:MAG TPA: hypothetical protein VGA37_04210 [Gemmatimonadales bacterium]
MPGLRRGLPLALVSALALTVLLLSCSDDTGPVVPMLARFSVRPVYETAAAATIEIAAIRFVLERQSDGTIARDTVLIIAAGQDSVNLELTVPVLTQGETFLLTLAMTNAAGDTVFRGGPTEVTPTTAGGGSPPAVTIVITYVGVGADAVGVEIVPATASTFTGEAVQLTARALDSSGDPIPGTPVVWSSADTAQATVPDADSGRVVGGASRGTARIVATLLTGQADTGRVAVQPLPTALAAESGDEQTAEVDSTLNQPLVARATAADGLGVRDLPIIFTVTQGGGTVSADTVASDSTGRASVQFTLGSAAGTHTVTATTPRLPGTPATFTATATAAAPATIQKTAGDNQTAIAGDAVAVAPAVTVLDAQSAPVPGATVTFEVTQGGGIATGSSQVTNAQGVATVDSWTLGTTAGANALRAWVIGALPTDTLQVLFDATGVAGPATTLAIVLGDAQVDTVAATLGDSLIVLVADANANPVSGAAIAWLPATGSLTADTTTSDAAGRAGVEWTLGTVAGATSTDAEIVGGTDTVTFNATTNAGTPVDLVFTTPPATTIARTTLAAVGITALDQFGNVTPLFVGTVTLALSANPGNAVLQGTTGVAAVAGIASFADLRIDSLGTGYEMQATATGLNPATSAPFDMIAGPPAVLTPIQGDAQTDTVAATLVDSLIVQVTDVNGNPTAGAQIDWLVTAGNGAVSAPSTPADAAGLAGIEWTIGTLAGTAHAVQATIAAAADTVVFGATATAGNPGRLVFLTQPSNVAPGDTIAPALDVATQDLFGNTVTAFSGMVTLAVADNPNSGSLLGTTALAAVAGQASFSDISVDNFGMGYTIEASSPGLVPDTSATFDVAIPPQGVQWLTAADGNWSVAANWSTGTVPGPLDTAIIGLSGNYTVTLDVSDSIDFLVVGGLSGTQTVLISGSTITIDSSAVFGPNAVLHLANGNLQGMGMVSVEGDFHWTGGTLLDTGPMRVEAGGTLTLDGGIRTLNTRTLENFGTATWTAGEISAGNAGAIVNGATGVFDIQADDIFDSDFGVQAVLQNNGTIVRTVGTGVATLDVLLSNDGTLDLQTGSLVVRGGGAATGSHAAQAGTVLDFAGGTYNMVAGSDLSAAGTVRFSGGTTTVSGTFTVTSPTEVTGGTVNFSGATPATTSVLVQTGGIVGGTGTLSISSDFTWSGGTQTDGGVTRVEAGGTMTIAGGVKTLNTRTVANAGAAVWTAGEISAGNAASFVNEAGGTFDAQLDDIFDSDFGVQARFTNQGTFTRTTGAGTVTFDVLFHNGGTADVLSGTLSLRGGGTSTGAFGVPVGALLAFSGGTNDLVAGSDVFGAGDVTISGGTAILGGGYAITGTTSVTAGTATFSSASTAVTTDLAVSGGIQDGGGVLSATNSFTWSGGTLAGSGETRLEAGGTMTIAGGVKTLNTRTVANAGAAVWTAGEISAGNAASFVNEAGGTFDAQLDDIFDSDFGVQASFSNQGTFTRTTGAGTVTFDVLFHNGGTADVLSGILSLRGGGTSTGAFGVPVGALLAFSGGTNDLVAGSDVSGAGDVTIGGGTAIFGGGYAITGTTSVTAGTATFSSASTAVTTDLAVSGGIQDGTGVLSATNSFTWSGGTLAGTGTTRLEATGTGVFDVTTHTLNTRTLELAGDVTWTVGQVSGGNGATMIIEAGATFDAQANDILDADFGVQPSYVNSGTITRTVGTGIMTIDGLFTNNNLLDVQSGTVLINGGGTLAGTTTIAAGAVLNLNSTISLLDGYSVTGAGPLQLIGGTTSIAAAETATADIFIQNGGTLTGAGTLSILAGFDWNGGTQSGTGLTRLEATGGGLFAGAVKTLDTRTIELAGDASWTAGELSAGNLGTLVVAPGATFDAQADGFFMDADFGVAPHLVVNGTLLRTTGTGVVDIDGLVDNTGLVHVLSGTLGADGGGTSTGTFTVDAGATLRFGGGTQSLNAGSDVNGAGTVQVAGGVTTVNDLYTPTGVTQVTAGTINFNSATTSTTSMLTQSGGTVGGTGTLSITTGFTWDDGSHLGSGITRLEAAGTGTFGGTTHTLDTRTMQLAGDVTWTAGQVSGGNGATMTIEAGATFDAQADDILDADFGLEPTYVNNGTFRRTTSAGIARVDGHFQNTGVLDIQTGTFAVNNNFEHLAGAAMFGTGTLDLTGATVVAFDGDVNPGASPGVLTVLGALPFGPGALVNIELNGTLAGTGYDRLAISGLATLDGFLDVTTGFTPAVGDIFTPITFGTRSGQINSVTGLDLFPATGLGMALDTSWTATQLELRTGVQILFSGDSAGGLSSGLFRTQHDGDFLVNTTTEGQFPDTYPRWAPDLSRITYTANNLLHVSTPDTLLTVTVAHLVNDTLTRRGRFSPDGRHLAFECGSSAFLGIEDVCTVTGVDAPVATLDNIGDGGGKVFVTDAVNANLGGTPSFAWDPTTPDRLVVARTDTTLGVTRGALYFVNVDGTGVSLIAGPMVFGGDSLIVEDIDVAPDGSFIVFTADSATRSSLYRINTDGSGLVRLTNAFDDGFSFYNDEKPVISPDGSTVLFLRHNFASEGSFWDLWSVSTGGGTATQISAETSSLFFSSDDLTYDWSPDGLEIVMMGTDGVSNVAIYVLQRTTTAATYLADRRLISRSIDAFDIQPSWRH